MRISNYTKDNHTQKDGSSYVQEEHIINGVVYTNIYLALADTDCTQLLEKRGLELEESLAKVATEKIEKEIFDEKMRSILEAEVSKETLTIDELEKYGYKISISEEPIVKVIK